MQTFIRRHETVFWLLLLTGIAAALRFYALTYQSYWFDELWSAYISKPMHSAATVIGLTMDDVHPPLYQLVMWLSYRIFGFTEWAGRLPSAVAGVLTIPVLYALGSELFNRRVGLYAAALAVVNYFLIYYAQEARSYAFLYFLTTLSFFYFQRALVRDSWSSVFAYTVATLLLLYTHYFGLVMVGAQALMVLALMLIRGRADAALLKRAGVAVAILAVGVLPLLPAMGGHLDISDFWIRQPGPVFFVSYFLDYFYSLLAAVVVALLIFIALFRVTTMSGWPQERLALLLLLLWVMVGYALPWVRGLIAQPVLTDRNTIMLIPALLLLAAYGLACLPQLWLQRTILLVVCSYSLFFLIADADYYGRVKKNQYRELVTRMGAYEPVLPVYTLEYNDTKFDIYFEQQGLPLNAIDWQVLDQALAEGEGPAIFWLADGHYRLMQTDLPDRYPLTEAGRLRLRGVEARLLVNEDAATRLVPESLTDAGSDDSSVSAAYTLPASGASRLIVALSEDRRDGSSAQARVAMLAADGSVVAAIEDDVGTTPLVVRPDGAVAARVTVPARYAPALVWATDQ